MSFRSLHGVAIGVSFEGFERKDMFEALLPVVAALPVVSAPKAELAIHVALGTPAEEARALVPLFFHGRTQAFLDGETIVLADGFSRVRVLRSGASISAQVDPRSLEDGYSFANATMFIALALALRAHGLFHLHAGAVVRPGGETILIAGEGGSGKTTSTLALLASGYDYLGDDAVLVTERRGSLELLQIPKPFHIHPRSLEAFPALSAHAGSRYRANHDKHSLDPRTAFAGRDRSSAGAPAFVLFPHVVDRDRTALVPVSQAEVMGELIRSSALAVVDGMPGVELQLRLFSELAGAARGFVLELGRDLLADPGVLARALEEG